MSSKGKDELRFYEHLAKSANRESNTQEDWNQGDEGKTKEKRGRAARVPGARCCDWYD